MTRQASPRKELLVEHYGPNGLPKRAFDTFDEAKANADDRNERDAGNKRPWVPHHCGYCDKFHVCHTPIRHRRRRRR